MNSNLDVSLLLTKERGHNARYGLIVRTLISVLLIVGMMYQIGSADVIGTLSTVQWPITALVVALLASNVFFVTPRWQLILAALGYPIKMSLLIGSVFLGFLFNQLLPTAVGGDVVRAWRAYHLGVPLAVAIYSVIIDRAAGVFASLVGTVVLFAFASTEARGPLNWIVGISIAAAAGMSLIMWGITRLPGPKSPIIRKLQHKANGLWNNIAILVNNRNAGIRVFILATINQFLSVAAILLLARELHIDLASADIIIIAFVAALVAAIPISIAGWGIREGALVFLFGLYHVPSQTAFALSLLFGASLTLASVPGFFFMRLGTRSSIDSRKTDSGKSIILPAK